jgi:manganese transport protein
VADDSRTPPLDGLHGSVSVKKRGWFRRLFAFTGPAYLVSVGYMDPGNWATDIEGGARFGYTLIWVLLMSNIMAVLLQTLSARLGIVTGYDLAQGCRREYPRPLNFALWIMAEIAIAATDLAEALGTIIGLNLLFGLPLLWGTVVTLFDTFLLLAIQRLGVRKMEAFIIVLVVTIGVAFLIEVLLAEPDWGGIAAGFVPRLEPGALFIAIGMIGATVMPHNLYLHSSLVQSRAVSPTHTGKKEACKFNLIDSAIALNAAFLVNAAILVMAAANFNSRGIVVTEIQQAHELLQPLLGTAIAPIAFALALLAAGQSSTLTGTLSGQIVMEGFLNIRMRPWLRRLVTRSIALVPAVIVIAIAGNEGTYKLLILSQVVLGLQLPFATIPLIHFTSDRGKMGKFVNRAWVKVAAWTVAAIIVSLNLALVVSVLSSWLSGGAAWLWLAVILLAVLLLGILGYVALAPLFGRRRVWESGVVTSGQAVASRIRPIRYRHIGVAVEHREGDADVISAALALVTARKARMTLLHVTETPGTMVYGAEEASLHGREDQAYLEELAREVEERDIAVETSLRYGSPVEEIVKAVDEDGYDLLILGSHGHRGLGDIVFGQTVSSVRHAVEIPVMVVRTRPSKPERAQRGGPSASP